MRLRLFTILCLILAGSGFATAAEAPANRPNIIYIMIDDAGYGDFGAMGSKHVQTPNFDRICAEGMRFTDHYSGSAVCAPTRCVLMTGLHTGHCRRRDNQAKAERDKTDENGLVFLKEDDLTVAEVLHQHGYVTAGIGKWGLGNPGSEGTPDRQGFDHFLGYLDQVHAHNHYTDWLWNDGEKMPTGKRYSHEIFEEDTFRFLHENKDRPFFLYLAYTLPHGQYVIPKEDPAYALYQDKDWPEQVRNYAAMITRVDRTVGGVLELLKELDLDRRTIVFYTSDNGPNAPFIKQLDSNGPFQNGKGTLFEGGIRAGLAVRWPGQTPAGVTSDFVWDMRDVFPTLCELAGAPVPAGLDGMSVLPTLLGKTQPAHEHLYWEYPGSSQQAVRIGTWKGLRRGTKSPVALYDLSSDPGEERDLAEQHPDVVRRMVKIMEESHSPSPFWPLNEAPKARKRK